MSTLSTELSKHDDFSVTRNDLTNDPCQRVTVIFARGTAELGNVGALVGPPFFNALEVILGAPDVAIQGVDYEADIAGYLAGGDAAGAADLATKANLAASKCPNTQLVLSGYRYKVTLLFPHLGSQRYSNNHDSQGAQVVHLGANLLPAATAARVKAVVVFGDPDRGQALQAISADNVATYCFETDLICDGVPIVLPAHLAYAVDALPAANFVVSKLS